MDMNSSRDLVGRTAIDATGTKIGTISNLYIDDQTGEPEWITVKTGLFGTNASFVPLRDASVRGDDVVLPYTKDLVKDAPNVSDEGHLEPSEEQQLWAHYGLTYGGWDADGDAELRGTGDDTFRNDALVDVDIAGTARSTDDAMTRSEEELEVGTREREAGRVRLRKWVETEREERTVPVTREEVRIEREPIDATNIDQALSGPEIREAEYEVVLHEEEPVVSTRVEPKERIRLETDEVTEQRTVGADVQKERIEIEDDRSGR